MDVVFLHNEGAGQGDYSRAKLTRLMRRVGFRPQYFPLEQALQDPKLLELGEFVAVAGGDGSVRAAVLALLGRGRSLAVLPLGTANNLARSVGLDHSPEEIISGWAKPRRIKLDVGFAKGPWGVTPFVEGVGFGVFCRSTDLLSDLDEVSSHEIERTKDRLHRDTVVALALAHECSALKLRFSTGHFRRSGQYVSTEVLNVSRIGPGVELAPTASPCDGYLDLVAVAVHDRSKLVTLLRGQLREERTARLGSRRVRRVTLSSGAGMCRIDDKIFRFSEPANIQVSIQAAAIELLVPQRRARR